MTGERMTIVGVEDTTLHVEWTAPCVPRSRWWRCRLWLAMRLSDLSYFAWPKDAA